MLNDVVRARISWTSRTRGVANRVWVGWGVHSGGMPVLAYHLHGNPHSRRGVCYFTTIVPRILRCSEKQANVPSLESVALKVRSRRKQDREEDQEH